jgi:hypothetical protein
MVLRRLQGLERSDPAVSTLYPNYHGIRVHNRRYHQDCGAVGTPFGTRVVSTHLGDLDFVSCQSVGSVTCLFLLLVPSKLIAHQSGVGKSSLINRVFGITDAVRGSHTTPDE